MPSELDFDTIKGLSKWRPELETDIYFENVSKATQIRIFDSNFNQKNICG
jgi:hypothetical protein